MDRRPYHHHQPIPEESAEPQSFKDQLNATLAGGPTAHKGKSQVISAETSDSASAFNEPADDDSGFFDPVSVKHLLYISDYCVYE